MRIDLKELASLIPVRALLARLAPVGALAVAGLCVWLALGWAEERGWLSGASKVKELATELNAARAPEISAPAPRQRAAEDRAASGGFCDARVELYISGTREKQVAAMARDFLSRHGVSWTEVDIDTDEHGCDRFTYLNPQKILPFAIINGRQITGFHPETWRRALSREDG